MGFVSSGDGGGSRRRAKRRPMSEINVTPMVDVMLVLLIIFIVAAPLLTTGVDVKLPEAKSPNLKQDTDALTLSVDAQGRLWLQETEVTFAQLAPRLKALTNANPDARIYVRGDGKVAYGEVMRVMGALYEGGFRNAALVTQPPKRR